MITKNIQKAAMFGLDARIALAIFGALSVITGASLYSAIQNTRVEQFHQVVLEVIKASEAYYLDNGKQLPAESANVVYMSDLVDNRENLPTWKGPYLNYGKRYNSDTYIFSSYNDLVSGGVGSGIMVLLLKKSQWPNPTSAVCNIDDIDCAEYIRFTSGFTAKGREFLENIFPRLDEKIDKGDGSNSGKVRFIDNGGDNCSIAYQIGIPRKRSF